MQRPLPIVAILSVLAGCNSSHRIAAAPAPRAVNAPPAMSATAPAAIKIETANTATSCVPTENQPETLALHERVREKTEWKSTGVPQGQTQVIKILGFNDFHGQLSPPPAIGGRAIGGAAVLAAYLRAAARGREDATLVLHAGDMIGASPPASALNQDEPTVEFMGSILGPGCTRAERASDRCRFVASLGNHEFDEGLAEFRRIVDGSNHARGPFLGHAYLGAPFVYIGANVHDKTTGKPIVEPYVVKNVAGVKVGLIGAVLRESPVFLMPSGIKNVSFDDEVSVINAAADTLVEQNVHTLVLVIHQGGYQCFEPGVVRDERAVVGPIVGIVKQLHPDIDLVVSGHTHSVLSALLPNRANLPTLVTQAFHASTGFADIELTVDTASGDVVAKQARIMSPWADGAPASDPALVAQVSRAESSVKAKTSQIIGSAAAALHAARDEAGNSELGDLIADAQREATGADVALTTPSWVRGDLNAGTVNWGDLFRVQPFGNRLMKISLTGKQIVALLNQQWTLDDHPRILHVSGIRFSWDAGSPANDRIVEVLKDDKPIIPERRYTVILNEYLAEGGDGFSLLQDVPRRPSGLLDIDALERYVKKHSPLRTNLEKRITRVH
jgi:5'-nucleotidase